MSLSLTAQEIIAKRKRNIEEREKANKAKQEQEEQQTPDPTEDPDDQPEDDQPGQDEGSYDQDDNDQDDQPGNGQPEEDDGSEEIDYKQKFERLRQKQSGIEKSKAQIAKEKEELAEKNRQLLAELEKERQQILDKNKSSADTDKPSSQADTTEEDVDAYLAKELGDDWEFMDESTKRATRFLAKQTLDLRKQEGKADPSSDVEKAVAKKLAEQEQKALIKQFNKDMDKFVDGLDKGSTFHEVVNEPDFDKYLKENRVARAMFVDAANNVDAEAKQMMQDVVSGYLGKKAITPNISQKNTAPDVKSKPNPRPKKKKAAVSEENIAWARKNIKRAGPLREKSLKILKKAQEAGLIK